MEKNFQKTNQKLPFPIKTEIAARLLNILGIFIATGGIMVESVYL